MKNMVLRKKFVLELVRWMNEYELDRPQASWIFEVHENTISNWLAGRTLPNGRNAVLLAYFAPEVKTALELLAGAPAAKSRLGEHHEKRSKAA